MVNFTLQFFHHNLKYIQLWITALDFSLGVPHPLAAIKAQTSSQDLLPPNSITANLCAYHTWITTIIPRSLCVLETHPQTHTHLEVTHVVTPTRRPMARLMQPVFLEILAPNTPMQSPSVTLRFLTMMAGVGMGRDRY